MKFVEESAEPIDEPSSDPPFTVTAHVRDTSPILQVINALPGVDPVSTMPEPSTAATDASDEDQEASSTFASDGVTDEIDSFSELEKPSVSDPAESANAVGVLDS